MSPKLRLPLLVVVSLLLSFTSPTTFAAPYTPLEWRGTLVLPDGTEIREKWVDWEQDQNRNFVDDALDELDLDSKVDIVVDFNRCILCDGTEDQEVHEFLASIGTVEMFSRAITVAVMRDVLVAYLPLLADRAEVAMVEKLRDFTPELNVSGQAVRVHAAPGVSCPALNIECIYSNLRGQGINVAVIDSGVDDAGGPAPTHVMFPAGTFAFGANCANNPCTTGNPDDITGHGTAVAGIILGRPINPNNGALHGLAPAARLVDIRVVQNNGAIDGAAVLRALDLVITNRDAWSIKVVNMSLGNCNPSNGANAVAQLINKAVSLGVSVVVPSGNTGPGCTPPGNVLINDIASATHALTVAASDDRNTVALGDDLLAPFSLRGPRLNDGDPDTVDELKPELTAPGVGIVSPLFNTTNQTAAVNGTSFAAPHVAGVAALMRQHIPTINTLSLKELLIQRSIQGASPSVFPAWNNGWGFGFLDAYRAASRPVTADVGSPTDPPYAPCNSWWCSPHIATASQPRVNQPNQISVNLRNFSAQAASFTRVCFGIYPTTNNSFTFHELGCAYVTVAANQNLVVNMPWTPSPGLIPPGTPPGAYIHACLKVSIGYPFDSRFTNNEMQRNISVQNSNGLLGLRSGAGTKEAPAPIRFPFRLENNTTQTVDAKLALETKLKWTVKVLHRGKEVDPAWTLGPDDCPKDLEIEIEPPPEAKEGDTEQVIVRALANGKDFGGAVFEATIGGAEPPVE